jgi:glycosyltransferase involved in cell wall biosynthesis
VATFHSIDRYHQKWGVFAKLILRLGEWSACTFPHETITVSKGLYNYCLNEFKTETIYIPNGVEILPAQEDAFIARFGLEKNKYFLMVSRLVPHKGAHVLINAFLNFKKENPDNQLKLVIAGDSVHTNKYRATLRELAKNREDILFTGFVSGKTLDSLYANTAALIHPSFNEGLPFAVLQAMSFGKPVLLSAIEAHLELSKNSEIFFKENNVSDLQEKIVEFVSWNPEKIKSLGEINQKMVVDNYNWEGIATRTSFVYNTLDKKTGLCYNTL